MPTQEIPREQWNDFFDSFSRQHEGWLASLEVFGKDVGAQQEGLELSFEGISLNSGDKESDSVVINVGKSPADHVSQTIDQPKHVWLQRTAQGADASRFSFMECGASHRTPETTPAISLICLVSI